MSLVEVLLLSSPVPSTPGKLTWLIHPLTHSFTYLYNWKHIYWTPTIEIFWWKTWTKPLLWDLRPIRETDNQQVNWGGSNQNNSRKRSFLWTDKICCHGIWAETWILGKDGHGYESWERITGRVKGWCEGAKEKKGVFLARSQKVGGTWGGWE